MSKTPASPAAPPPALPGYFTCDLINKLIDGSVIGATFEHHTAAKVLVMESTSEKWYRSIYTFDAVSKRFEVYCKLDHVDLARTVAASLNATHAFDPESLRPYLLIDAYLTIGEKEEQIRNLRKANEDLAEVVKRMKKHDLGQMIDDAVDGARVVFNVSPSFGAFLERELTVQPAQGDIHRAAEALRNSVRV